MTLKEESGKRYSVSWVEIGPRGRQGKGGESWIEGEVRTRIDPRTRRTGRGESGTYAKSEMARVHKEEPREKGT